MGLAATAATVGQIIADSAGNRKRPQGDWYRRRNPEGRAENGNASTAFQKGRESRHCCLLSGESVHRTLRGIGTEPTPKPTFLDFT